MIFTGAGFFFFPYQMSGSTENVGIAYRGSLFAKGCYSLALLLLLILCPLHSHPLRTPESLILFYLCTFVPFPFHSPIMICTGTVFRPWLALFIFVQFLLPVHCVGEGKFLLVDIIKLILLKRIRVLQRL
jgi:hypothetical protein